MRRIIQLLIFVSLTGTIHGQGLEIGVYTEPQFAWITSDEGSVASDGSVIHLNSGIHFDIYFMPAYAFTIGLDINNLGGKLRYRDSTDFEQTNGTLTIPEGITASHNLQYLSFPVGLKLKTTEMGFTTFYFHAGFSPMLNTRGVTSSSVISVNRENIKPEINRFSLGYFVSGGIEYRLAGNTALVAGLKWTSGFNDVTANDLTNNNLKSAGLHIGIIF